MKKIGFPLYYNHVPKCAGTTLTEVLSRNLHCEQLGVEPFLTAVELYTLRAARFDRLALVASHVPHWVAVRRMADWTRLTVLREPWSRFLALCRHLVRIEGSEPDALRAEQVEFLRLLRGKAYDAAIEQTRAWYPTHASMTSYFLPDPVESDRLPRGAAARAVEALRTYDLVLLTDRLHDDALWIDRVFNGQDYGARARLNRSTQYRDAASGPFPESFARHFADLYPHEHDVYDAARERYPATRAWLRDEGRDRRDCPRGPEPMPPPLYTLDWAAPTRCGGFSDRMFAASLGYLNSVARRVEAEVAQLEFELPRTGSVRLEAVVWVSPVNIQFGVEVRLNGKPVPLFDARREIGDPNQIWSCVDVDAATVGDGRCRLEIDRRGARGLQEFWLLDFVVRAR